jgi:hypothetical protein
MKGRIQHDHCPVLTYARSAPKGSQFPVRAMRTSWLCGQAQVVCSVSSKRYENNKAVLLHMKKLSLLLITIMATSSVKAGEGGISNYIPGFYGDLALAVEPPEGLSIRNDLYVYSADGDGSVRSGQIEFDAELDLTFNYLRMV